MKKRAILSIDWDYFFPDEFDFDWSHTERMAFMLEGIWLIRAYSHSMKGEVAINVFNPKVPDNFWKKVCPRKPLLLVVAESHQDLAQLIYRGDIVYNFDAHHDCGYQSDELDCGSWAKTEKISEYHLVYPSWRKDAPEIDNDLRPIIVHHDIPTELPRFHVVFVCRSSAWTPPWADKQWMEFVTYWERYPEIWENRLKSPYASKPREWDQAEAHKLQMQFEEQINEYRNNVRKTSELLRESNQSG